ncbi:hypothetical protein [Lysobacter gummosus]|uniref:hypothetical protein n=1 Tax=Lysobacter gummosus TaxID=262324 RepID=UPI0036254B30
MRETGGAIRRRVDGADGEASPGLLWKGLQPRCFSLGRRAPCQSFPIAARN